MTATITQPQEKIVRELLKRGPWRNESEIVRHGIELVRQEMERESLSPLSEEAAAKSYAAMTEDEIALDVVLGEASMSAQKGRS